MGSAKHIDSLPQAQDDPDFELGCDLHALEVAAKVLADSGRVSAALNMILHDLVRALDGCRECKQTLGEMHSGSCPSGGFYVMFFDLDEADPKAKTEPTPF